MMAVIAARLQEKGNGYDQFVHNIWGATNKNSKDILKNACSPFLEGRVTIWKRKMHACTLRLEGFHLAQNEFMHTRFALLWSDRKARR